MSVRASYDLAVTIPSVWRNCIPPTAGIYPHAHFFGGQDYKDLHSTVSLSEPFEGFHYKLVAGVVNILRPKRPSVSFFAGCSRNPGPLHCF